MARRKRKFHTASGVQVRSDLERRVIEDLGAQNVPYRYEEVTLPWKHFLPSIRCLHCQQEGVAYKQRWYTPDVSLSPTFHVEIKGRFTADDRATVLGARDQNPGHTIVLLFETDNWMTRTRSTRYSDWAMRNGFDYAIGDEIPYGWIAHVHGWTDAYGWDDSND